MPRINSNYYTKLVSQYNQILITRGKIEKLCKSGDLSNRDVKKLYSGLFINSVTSFEGYLEQIFIAHLIHPNRNIIPRFTVKSHKIAYEILSGDRSYIDWLPYRNTKDRALRCFRSGFPYSNITTSEESRLDIVCIIRNALAHNSKHADIKFEKKVTSQIPLRKRESTPTGYLRATFRSSPRMTYFELHLNELLHIAYKIDL